MAAVADRQAQDRTIVFAGFMGAGKSKALVAAREAGLGGVDLDELIEREAGAPPAELFAREGEEGFRRREAEVARRALAGGNDAVALGGGAVLSAEIREALAGHLVVWLDVDAGEAWSRVEDSERERPLARDRAAFVRLHAEREPAYAELADAIVVAATRESVRAALPALVELRARPGLRLLWAASASGQHPVWVGDGALGRAPWPAPGRRFCVTDTVVAGHWGERVGSLTGIVEVEPGEGAKSLAHAERVLRELARLGATRSDHVVALGGGVVGDLAGFCAATYQRGVALVQAPTTLLAQVDSSLGGKTGVDLPEAKNYVGAYHLPAGVIADTATLGTLPERELASGYVEALKTGLVAGGWLWDRVRGIAELEPAALEPIVVGCARAKLAIVAADERDAGRRAVLNLGHTVGHAIEAASAYRRYSHGEAVGLGLLAALRLSDASDLRKEVGELLAGRGLPVELDPGVAVEDILAAVERDKKRGPGGVGFVLLEGPGRPAVGERVDPASLLAAIEELRGR